MTEAKFLPLLSSSVEAFKERPARAFFALLTTLWVGLLFVALAVLPGVLVGAIFGVIVDRKSGLYAGASIVTISAIVLAFILLPRAIYTLYRLYCTEDHFFEAWANSAQQRSRTLNVAGLSLIFGLLGLLAFILPAFLVGAGLSLATVILVLEDLEPKETLKASWQLMSGYKLKAAWWTIVLFAGGFAIQTMLGYIPMAGAILTFCFGFFVAAPLRTLFFIELYQALKARPRTGFSLPWRSFTLAAILGLLIFGSMGALIFTHLDAAKALFLRFKPATAAFVKAQKLKDLAEGEPAEPIVVSEAVSPTAATAPFDAAWTGVSPGELAVSQAGTYFISDKNDVLRSYTYDLSPKGTHPSEVKTIQALTADATGNLYALSVGYSPTAPAIQRWDPDLRPTLLWEASPVGKGGCNSIALVGGALWHANTKEARIDLYDLDGHLQRQGHWPDKDPGEAYNMSLAASQEGQLLLVVDKLDWTQKPPQPYRHAYALDTTNASAAGDPVVLWDLAQPVQLGAGYALVAFTWEGIPMLADRHGLQALPGGQIAHVWTYNLGAPLRGFAIDPWGVAHLLDATGRLQRINSVSY
jgi:hypothetical protein